MKYLFTLLLLSSISLLNSQSSMTNEGGDGLVLFIGDVTVHCDADFTNSATGNLVFKSSDNPELQVDGDYTISAASTFTVGISEIEMTGSSLQYLDSGGKDHYHVNINNTSGNVYLTGNDLSLTNTLTFSSGRLILGTVDCIIENTASITGASLASFAVPASTGVFTIQDIGGAGAKTGSIEFPVGYSPISTAYSPLEIDNDPGTAGDFSVRMDDDILDGGTSGSVISTYVVDRTWHVTTTSGSPSVILKATWHSSQEIGGFNRTQSYFSKWVSGTDWNQASSGASATDEGGGFYSRTMDGRVSTAAKPWAIASNDQLPIELIEFDAQKAENKVALNWTTATEINNDYFIVEKSIDGENFEPLLEKDGAGNSIETIDYEDFDFNPIIGINYYRLKQVDFDGTSSYSNIKSVLFSSNNSSTTVSLYPNPGHNTTMNISTPTNQTFRLKVIGDSGQEVYSALVPCFKGENLIPIDISIMASGIYYIRIISNNGEEFVQTYSKL